MWNSSYSNIKIQHGTKYRHLPAYQKAGSQSSLPKRPSNAISTEHSGPKFKCINYRASYSWFRQDTKHKDSPPTPSYSLVSPPKTNKEQADGYTSSFQEWKPSKDCSSWRTSSKIQQNTTPETTYNEKWTAYEPLTFKSYNDSKRHKRNNKRKHEKKEKRPTQLQKALCRTQTKKTRKYHLASTPALQYLASNHCILRRIRLHPTCRIVLNYISSRIIHPTYYVTLPKFHRSHS